MNDTGVTKTERGITVAIDGPAGAGKSTLAKALAQALGYTLVDTGAIYRAVALLAAEQGIAADDDAALEALATDLDIAFRFEDGNNRVLLAGRDVSEAIRAPRVSRASSEISARPGVRRCLLDLQRRLAGAGGAVLEGRDIGTIVCPDAPVKIYLTASPEERARRRVLERRQNGQQADYDAVLQEQRRRDAQDKGRAHAPLRPAENAIHFDSTDLTVEQMLQRVLAEVRRSTAVDHDGGS